MGQKSVKQLPDTAWVSGWMMVPLERTIKAQGEDSGFVLHVAFVNWGNLRRAVQQATCKGLRLAQRCRSEFCLQSHQIITDGSCHRLRKGDPGRWLWFSRRKALEWEGGKKENPMKKAEVMPLLSQAWRKFILNVLRHPLDVMISRLSYIPGMILILYCPWGD